MKITFIGGGNMASALIGGMIKRGFHAEQIHVVEPEAERRQQLEQEFAISTAAPEAALPKSDAILLAVKPQQLRDIAQNITGQIGNALIISIAAWRCVPRSMRRLTTWSVTPISNLIHQT